MTYRHLNTGVVAELVEQKELTVVVKLIETGELKDVGLPTFKRWWKDTSFEEPAVQESPELPEEAKGGALPALSEIANRLEDLFDMLNRLHFEGKLPRPIITIQSTPKSFGHCSTKKIWSSDQYEINIGAEFLNRPSEFLAATMLHEMVHLYCRENDLEETCQNGRYHNKLFKTEAEARGLSIEYDRASGYSGTLPTEAFIEGLRSNGYSLNVPFARHTFEKEKKKAERAKAHAYICPTCGQQVRTTQELSLICGICKVVMEKEGD